MAQLQEFYFEILKADVVCSVVVLEDENSDRSCAVSTEQHESVRFSVQRSGSIPLNPGEPCGDSSLIPLQGGRVDFIDDLILFGGPKKNTHTQANDK